MKFATTIVLIVLMAALSVYAQTPPPLNATSSVDMDGNASVQWMAPFDPDYLEDFEDDQAQGWMFDTPGNWSVADGYLTTAFFGGAYSSAYYADQTIDEGVFESRWRKTLGNRGRNVAMAVFTDGFFPEDAQNGWSFHVSVGFDQGSFAVSKIVDGQRYTLTNRPSPAVVPDLNSWNTTTIAYQGNSIAFYINGTEVYTQYVADPLSGHFALAASEQGGTFPDFGTVQWDYVAIDHADAAMLAAGPTGDGFFSNADQRNELDEFLNYRVYRDDNFQGTSDIEMFTEALPDYGIYQYTVTADYDEGESTADTASVFYQDPNGWIIEEDFNDGFPDGWMIESTVPDCTWHIDDGSELGLFDTPYMLINDAGGATLDDRLNTPEFNVTDAELVACEFSYWLFRSADELAFVDYRVDGGEWTTFYVARSPRPDTSRVFYDLTDAFAGAETAQLSFQFWEFMPGDGLYWGVDDVRIYVQGATTPDVILTLAPQNTTIPSGGGTLTYDVSLMSNLPGSFNIRYWTEVMLPDGNVFGPLMNVPFTMTPFMDQTVQGLTQDVPNFAPSGQYTFMGYVGYMGGPNIMDSFMFTKEGTAAGSPSFNPSDWQAGGMWTAGVEDETATKTLPDEYSLSNAYPNPFNPSTTINVALPESAELTVAVYDVTGRLVATLANGSFGAGTHSLTFDGGNLSSGLYFVEATVPGQLNEVRKVTLMK